MITQFFLLHTTAAHCIVLSQGGSNLAHSVHMVCSNYLCFSFPRCCLLLKCFGEVYQQCLHCGCKTFLEENLLVRLLFFSMHSSELFLLNTGIKVRWVTTSHPEMTTCSIDFFISLVSKGFSCIYSFLQGMLYFGDVFFHCLWFSVLATPAWNRFINDIVPTRAANHPFVLNSKSWFSTDTHSWSLSFSIYFVWRASLLWILLCHLCPVLMIIPLITSSADPLPIHFLSGCWLKGFVC